MEAVKYLVGKGADVNAKSDGIKPLDIAALSEKLEVVEYPLVEKGADVNAKDKVGYSGTPLHIAAMNGKLEVVEYLVEKGAKMLRLRTKMT